MLLYPDAAIKFYREKLGAEVSAPQVIRERGWDSTCQLSPVSHQPQPEHGVYTVFINVGNTKIEVRPDRGFGTASITTLCVTTTQLIHPYGDKSPIVGFLEKNKSGGMHHICLEVETEWLWWRRGRQPADRNLRFTFCRTPTLTGRRHSQGRR